jgi:hypothetical protein
LLHSLSVMAPARLNDIGQGTIMRRGIDHAETRTGRHLFAPDVTIWRIL